MFLLPAKWERVLVALGSALVAFNMVLQVLDWIASFIGYYVGDIEV